ncbi:MAG: SgcJ/EcaC family oxidoreductase [Parachlamydiaceae bacterium]|nr:SgcJ/EcaC family oxidoreductase [Parachlamydiaceae bacterium]
MPNIIFYLMLLLAALPLHGDDLALSRDDEKGVRALLEAHYNAWNKHDTETMADLYTPDGDLRTTENKIGKNPKEIKAILSDQHSHLMKDAHIEGVIKSIQLIKPDVVFVDAESTITGMKALDKHNNSRLHHHVVFVLVKREGQWKILIGRPF